MRWRIDLEYDGRDFFGWQQQAGDRTVQGVLQEVLEGVLGHPVRVHGAGRTDAGVHAEQQVAIFDTEVVRDPRGMCGALRARLPDDVVCLDARVVPESFDPRHSRHVKRYRYAFLDRPARSPLRRDRLWHVRFPLDEAAMAAGVAHLVGEHDFSSFRAAGCSSTHPIRTLQRAEVVRVADEVHLTVEGSGFLRHMIRIIAGTLVEVGRGRRLPAWIGEVRDAHLRSAAGRTAPAGGLTLAGIWYRPEP